MRSGRAGRTLDAAVTVYLDIETSFEGAITVIGLLAPGRGILQLIGGGISDLALIRALDGAETICTYNGTRFDLPVIRRRLGLDLAREFRSRDLMYECWRYGLYGGLKRVEAQLGIARRSTGITGWDAMRLWSRYEAGGDEEALRWLLLYNQDDVVSLQRIDMRLCQLGRRDASGD
jgi:hypothetical protein